MVVEKEVVRQYSNRAVVYNSSPANYFVSKSERQEDVVARKMRRTPQVGAWI